MKKLACFLTLSLLLSFFCACKAEEDRTRNLIAGDFFDTLCVVYYDGAEVTDPSFPEEFRTELQTLHRLFDAYGDADVPNLKTVNDMAGRKAVQVDRRLSGLLVLCRDFSALSGGTVDPMIGAVSSLWKKAAADNTLPDDSALKEAALHISPDALVVDEESSSVFITDPAARIDLGASAKGYAAGLMGKWLDERKITNYLLSFGGTILARGVNPRTGKPWTVGVKDPFASEDAAAARLELTGAAFATSGNYERCFTVDGKNYHHIIDPQTCAPAARTNAVSVSVLHSDPALADLLSTALFILSEEEGNALLEKAGGEALRIDASKNISRSDGFPRDQKSSVYDDAPVFVFLALLLVCAVLLILLGRRKDGREQRAESRQTEDRDLRKIFADFKKRDAALLCLILAAAILLPFILLFGGKNAGNEVAVVRVEGRIVKTLPLDRDGDFRWENDGAYNTVTVRSGKVSVSDADCKGKDCVRTAAIDASSTIAVIACLPHRLTVSIEQPPADADE